MLIIRSFLESDYSFVVQLQREALIHIGAWKGDGPWDDDLSSILSVYNGVQGEFLIGELDGYIVALGAFFMLSDQMAEIRRMRVAPNHQGKGFATAIYLELEKRAFELGARRLILDTGETQLAACRFYERQGFAEYDRKEIWGMKCILYQKMLQ